MLPVSILHILVQTKGAELAARELARVDSAGKAAGDNLSGRRSTRSERVARSRRLGALRSTRRASRVSVA
jgi:hypothetical protein